MSLASAMTGAALALIVATTSCGGTSKSSTPSASTTTTSTTIGPSSASTSTSVFAGATTATSATATRATLIAFRHGAQQGTERIVFEFQGGPPGYQVLYASGHGVSGPSGQPTSVAGDAALQVTFNPAMAHDDQGRPTLPARHIEVKEQNVVEMALAEDFEGHVMLAVGVLGHPAFHVSTLSSPPRVAIDFAA